MVPAAAEMLVEAGKVSVAAGGEGTVVDVARQVVVPLATTELYGSALASVAPRGASGGSGSPW